jgi:hypothetical protein
VYARGVRLIASLANEAATPRGKEAPVFAVVSALVEGDTESGKGALHNPPYGLRANGPLMTGARAGDARGAGIRF